jgi:hypothetical protein
MSFRTQLLLVLMTLLLTASLALAAPAAPATPQAPAVSVAQPLAALVTADAVCKGAEALVFSPAPQPTADDTCGACSDAACVGKMVNSVCGSGLRCIGGGPSCTAGIRSCRCLII